MRSRRDCGCYSCLRRRRLLGFLAHQLFARHCGVLLAQDRRQRTSHDLQPLVALPLPGRLLDGLHLGYQRHHDLHEVLDVLQLQLRRRSGYCAWWVS